MLKIILIIVFLCTALVTNHQQIKGEVYLTKRQAPYEIQSIEFKEGYLEIKGWAFIDETQHYTNQSDHHYEMHLISPNHQIVQTDFINYNLNQTEQVRYRGVPQCSQTQYNKTENICYYSLTNVGFLTRIPLVNLSVNEEYTVYLKIFAHNANRSGMINLYYPIKNSIKTTNNDYIYEANSSLDSTSLMVHYDTVLARGTPSLVVTGIQYGTNCSTTYQNFLFHKSSTVYSNVIEQKIVGDNTWYRVSGKLAACEYSRRRIIEGTTINNIWILSNHVTYNGTPLKISKKINAAVHALRFIDLTAIEVMNSVIWTELAGLRQVLEEQQVLKTIE